MSTIPKTKTTDLITVMEYWAKTISKNGGVAAVTIQEGADRLRELQAHIEKAETELAASRSECARLQALGSWAHTCTHHTDEQRTRAERCPVCATAERDQLRSDCENETKWAAHYLAQSIADKARAERAEDNLAALEQCHDDNCRGVVKIADELATERARLDYLSTRGFEHRHHETGDHLGYEWTISSYSESEDVTLRDVIDAEMQEEAK